jgi:tol-pal system protein YbgF
MIDCKKHIIAACFTFILPIMSWAEAPVVDDSENFAIMEGQRISEAPSEPKYDEPVIDQANFDQAHRNNYQVRPASHDDSQPLVKEDSTPRSMQQSTSDSASLIEKVLNLQKEVQELRGQLEVQAHDLKLLQQQQVAFYKDLDARISGGATKSAQAAKPAINLDAAQKKTNLKGATPKPVAVPTPAIKAPATTKTTAATSPVSRGNPADEQISYLAAYELVKNKKYDNAIDAMQAFIQKYPNGGYTANAEYWLGELYLVKKDYTKAIEHFDTVLAKFPSSTKTAASLLKTGYAYSASGNNPEAKKRFELVVRNYPNTQTAQLANSKLNAIRAL